jgi:hypothetical protein
MLMPESAKEFRRKHFSVFVMSMFLGVFSSVSALALATGVYFKSLDIDLALKISFAFLLVVTVFQTICGFNILRGRPRWVNGIASLLYFYLLFSVFTIVYDQNPGLCFFALATSLIGLCCVNSKRYRAMLHAAEAIRLERIIGPQHKLKISGQQAAINNRLRAKTEQSVGISDRSITMMVVICWGISIFFVLVIGMKLYFVYEGVANGVVVAGNRHGPPKSYSLAVEPWMYGSSMFLHLLTIAVCALFLKLMLLLRK